MPTRSTVPASTGWPRTIARQASSAAASPVVIAVPDRNAPAIWVAAVSRASAPHAIGNCAMIAPLIPENVASSRACRSSAPPARACWYACPAASVANIPENIAAPSRGLPVAAVASAPAPILIPRSACPVTNSPTGVCGSCWAT
jgi:hypothetical protein